MRRLQEFPRALPEIAIDERYLENLRFSKMSSADKAEKIIRDIETIIRREEARNPAYVDLDVACRIHPKKRDLNADIEQILLDLEKLYTAVDEVGNLPHGWALKIAGATTCSSTSNMRRAAAFDETRRGSSLTCW